ncbi:hypothetical protein BaRGS_00032545 [Batillaria attramentaria]|uniref:Uncharacterized protein n=1 Tax=Batillaria attramentaria TaxID=370345 RepID=A0ABD0JNB3_9CAEN
MHEQLSFGFGKSLFVCHNVAGQGVGLDVALNSPPETCIFYGSVFSWAQLLYLSTTDRFSFPTDENTACFYFREIRQQATTSVALSSERNNRTDAI